MGILDPKFRYVPAAATDIRKTFARVRRQLAKDAAERARGNEQSGRTVVSPLRRRDR